MSGRSTCAADRWSWPLCSSGEADYAIMAGVTAVTSISRGADVVIVGGHTAYIDQVLVGAKSVTKLSDLKGKVVGVTGAGGVTEFATVEALARKGSRPRQGL